MCDVDKVIWFARLGRNYQKFVAIHEVCMIPLAHRANISDSGTAAGVPHHREPL